MCYNFIGDIQMANKVNAKKINDENEMKKFIKMILIVTLIFGVFYVLTIFINKESKDSNENNNSGNNSVSIQYDEILIGNIFKQKNDKYYVLIEDIDDVNVPVYKAYLSQYQQKGEAKRVYTAVLNNMFNSKYFHEKSNLTNDISKFKVSQTTLLEISKGKIINSYEEQENILKVLIEISKVDENEEK